ncbi:hypothetical protein BDR26DRAFT_235835 [Obelidium mucronatum]|nr:hypothetical protein BDR26DRAFT_235835 [Obelidium mucronatum]
MLNVASGRGIGFEGRILWFYLSVFVIAYFETYTITALCVANKLTAARQAATFLYAFCALMGIIGRYDKYNDTVETTVYCEWIERWVPKWVFSRGKWWCGGGRGARYSRSRAIEGENASCF